MTPTQPQDEEEERNVKATRIGTVPITFECEGRDVEASNGAEEIALNYSKGIASLEGPDVHGKWVKLKRSTFEALVWKAYIQGRADEMATRQARQ
jgi:hypothetical protein